MPPSRYTIRLYAGLLTVLASTSVPEAGAAALGDSVDNAPPAGGVGQYRIRVEEMSADLVGGIYREQLADWLTTQWSTDPVELAAVLADPERFRYATYRTQFDVTTEGLEGDWEFLPPSHGARWPTSAVRTVDRSTEPRFDVERIVYCAERTSACQATVELADALAIPSPAFPGNAPSGAQWKEYIYTRPCTPAAASMPAPRYPASARRLGLGGKVVMDLVVDPCGQVHDAWVSQGSGVPELDRVAIQSAMRWRVSMSKTDEPGRGARMRVPVSFSPETSGPDTDETPSPPR